MSWRASMPRPAGPEVIFFDAAGTLIQVRRPVGEVYASVAQEFGWVLPGELLGGTFSEVFRRMPPPDWSVAHGEREWWQNLVREVLALYQVQPSGDEFQEYFTRLWEYYATAAAWSVFPEVPEVLGRLTEKHRLGVISNFDERLTGVLDGLGLLSSFQSITFSGQVRSRKPSQEIFAAALADHGLETGENTVHVGDDREADWKGARVAGLGWYELRRPERDLRDLEVWLTGCQPVRALTWREISLTSFSS